jgi:hypothetical protein
MKKPTPSLQQRVPASDRGHSWNKGPLGPALIWEHVRRGPYFGNAPIPGQYPTQNLTDVVEVSVSKYPLGSGCGIWVIFYIPYLHSRFGLKLYYFSNVKILIIKKFLKFYLEGNEAAFGIFYVPKGNHFSRSEILIVGHFHHLFCLCASVQMLGKYSIRRVRAPSCNSS